MISKISEVFILSKTAGLAKFSTLKIGFWIFPTLPVHLEDRMMKMIGAVMFYSKMGLGVFLTGREGRLAVHEHLSKVIMY